MTAKAKKAASPSMPMRAPFPVAPYASPSILSAGELWLAQRRAWAVHGIPWPTVEAMIAAAWAAAAGTQMEFGSAGVGSGWVSAVGAPPSEELRRALDDSWVLLRGALGWAIPVGCLGTWSRVSYDGQRGRAS